MESINKVFLRGVLTNIVRLRYFEDDRATARFQIATTREYIHPKTQQKIRSNQHHKIVVDDFEKAVFCEENLREGMWVSLEGRLANIYSEEMGLPRIDTYVYAHQIEPIETNS